MEVKIKVYDDDVHQLIRSIDEKARGFDRTKFGLPFPMSNEFKVIVYNWLHKNRVEKTSGEKWLISYNYERGGHSRTNSMTVFNGSIADWIEKHKVYNVILHKERLTDEEYNLLVKIVG